MPTEAEFPQSFEILEMILMHLPRELNDLRMINRRFNKVITNSVPLLKRCKLKWSHKSEHRFRSTGRLFCNVQFTNIWKADVPSLLQFVHQHHPTLSKIEFDFYTCVFTAKQFHEILSLVAGTIKDLAMLGQLESNAVLSRLVLPKLDSLTLNKEAMNFFDYLYWNRFESFHATTSKIRKHRET